MRKTLLRLAVTAAVIVPIAGCSDGNDRDDDVVVAPPSPPAPPAAGSLESIGASFAAIFRADANSEPRDPAEGDLPPVNLTAEAVEITGT